MSERVTIAGLTLFVLAFIIGPLYLVLIAAH